MTDEHEGPRKRHTPGPWESAGLLVYKGGDDNGMVCEISSPRRTTWVEHHRVELDDPDWDEAVANLRLIRAAPDLLDAVKFAVDYLVGAPGGEVSPTYLTEKLLRVIEQAEKGTD